MKIARCAAYVQRVIIPEKIKYTRDTYVGPREGEYKCMYQLSVLAQVHMR